MVQDDSDCQFDLYIFYILYVSASKNRLEILQLGTPGRSIFLCRELARTHQRPYIFHHFCGTTSRARGNTQPKARPQLHHKVGSLSMAKRCESVGVSPWAHEPVSPWARETQTKQDLHALCPRPSCAHGPVVPSCACVGPFLGETCTRIGTFRARSSGNRPRPQHATAIRCDSLTWLTCWISLRGQRDVRSKNDTKPFKTLFKTLQNSLERFRTVATLVTVVALAAQEGSVTGENGNA